MSDPILVMADDREGIRNAVAHVLSRRRGLLDNTLDAAATAREILASSDDRAASTLPTLLLRASEWPDDGPYLAPKVPSTYPKAARNAWRKRTRRANSHGQRRR